MKFVDIELSTSHLHVYMGCHISYPSFGSASATARAGVVEAEKHNRWADLSGGLQCRTVFQVILIPLCRYVNKVLWIEARFSAVELKSKTSKRQKFASLNLKADFATVLQMEIPHELKLLHSSQ